MANFIPFARSTESYARALAIPYPSSESAIHLCALLLFPQATLSVTICKSWFGRRVCTPSGRSFSLKLWLVCVVDYSVDTGHKASNVNRYCTSCLLDCVMVPRTINLHLLSSIV